MSEMFKFNVKILGGLGSPRKTTIITRINNIRPFPNFFVGYNIFFRFPQSPLKIAQKALK